MTPRGGIKPHNRFPIQANRSEVLFVDYITEHLTSNGKAGIIVPEGIIFQSGNVYKQLRKMLVEDGLWAVVSLPQGVFNPYSLVKTSILFFNNTIARQTKEILFIKVENDGFDLGSQRRPVDENDLPTRLEVLKKYKKAVQENKKFNLNKDEEKFTSVVKKEKIAKDGEYNLSASRYIEVVENKNQKWPLVELKDICVVDWGNTNLTKSSYVENGEYLGVSAAGCDGRVEKYEHKIGVSVLSAIGANCGRIFYPSEKFTAIKNTITFTPNQTKILPKYLFYILENNKLPHRGGGQPFISKGDTQKYKIPLPPLEVQQQIVAELDGYQKIIDGARQIADNYKPTIKIDPKWEIKKLGDVCNFVRGPFGGSLKKEIFVKDGFAVYEQSHAISGDFSKIRYFINSKKFQEMKRFEVLPGDLIMSCSGTMGKTVVVPPNIKKGIINQALLKLSPGNKLSVDFLKLLMDTNDFQEQLLSTVSGVAIKNVSSVKVLQNLVIPLPPIEIQKQIISQIAEEKRTIATNEVLIKLFEQKIKDKISEVWGE